MRQTKYITKKMRRRHRIARHLNSDDAQQVIQGIWEATRELPNVAYGLEVCERAFASADAVIRYNAVLGLMNLAQRVEKLAPEIPAKVLAAAFADGEEHVRCAAQDVAAFVNEKYGWSIAAPDA